MTNPLLLKGAQLMFYIINLLLGISMTYLGLSIQLEMAGDKSQCPESVRNSNTGVLVLGLILLTTTLCMGWSKFTHAKCTGISTEISETHLKGYYAFTLVVSIVLTTLGAIMKNKVDNAGTSDSCKKIKDKATFVMTVGIVGIVLTMTPLVAMAAFHGGKRAHSSYKDRVQVNNRKKVLLKQAGISSPDRM